MANKTIGQLTLATSALDADLIEFEIAASGLSRRITKANFIGATLTGGGTIATGGFTLTVPATGTASLLGTAQTYSALKTFSAGIKFAHETLSQYREGTWTPEIQGSSSNPTVTYTTQTGTYWRFNNLVFYRLSIVVNTISGGGGNARFTLPFTVAAAGGGVAPVNLNNTDVPGTPFGTFFLPSNNNGYGSVFVQNDNAAATVLPISNLAAGDEITTAGFYSAA